MLKEHVWDVVVIGAGPAGYVAAIRCAQLGLKTVCVDEWLNHKGESSLGGTCLNVGCIPSKALLESSHLYQQATSEFDQHGISISSLGIDIKTMQSRKAQVVSDLTQGILSLFKANNVEIISGRAKIIAHDTIEIISRKTRKKFDELKTKNIIIATGSSPVRLQQAVLKDNYIVDSAGALELDEVPKRLGIIGAGAIGLELGSVWSRLGSEVVLLEAMKDFLPMADKKLAALAKRSFNKQSLDIRLNSRLVSAEVKNKKVHIVYEDTGPKKLGEKKETFDKLIIAVGRKPNSDRVFGEELGIEKDERCFILVDENCQTSVPNIYAIGDIVRGPMLAHKGSEEGIMVAELIAGKQASVNYDLIPAVIYTHPEVAWAGKTEDECKSAGIKVKVGSFPFLASGRARAMAETEGLVKIIADAETDRVIGVHIFSVQASELIAQAVLMMDMQATAEDIALTMFAHPTLSEAMHEAALSVHKQAIHIKN
ncbi:Dihydrolipoamide dehydrogenase of 2-oxoglutarate dehydrogenase [hydrothermal vent metagenome]|uniref:Dihydrolipoyl dehydrogenase n=1 Tax=hydrothermal vent metagenome TaxID=652676 RepID=A0A3B0WLW6_9ZZZZ